MNSLVLDIKMCPNRSLIQGGDVQERCEARD